MNTCDIRYAFSIYRLLKSNLKYPLKALAEYIDKVFRNNPKWEEVKRRPQGDRRFVFFERIAE